MVSIVCGLVLFFSGAAMGWYAALGAVDTQMSRRWYPLLPTTERVYRLAEDARLNQELLLQKSEFYAKTVRELTEWQRGERRYEEQATVIGCSSNEDSL